MPASFVDQQVQFVATASRAAGGPGRGRLERRRPAGLLRSAHRAEFDTVCFTAAVFSSAERGHGGGGRRWPPARRSPRWRRAPRRRRDAAVWHARRRRGRAARRAPNLGSLAVGRRVRPPIAATGTTTSCVAHQADADALRRRSRPPWPRRVQQAGAEGDADGAHRGRAARHGERRPAVRRSGCPRRPVVFAPLTPETSDVLNAVGEPGRRRAGSRPARPAAERWRGSAPTSRWWVSGPPAPTSSAPRAATLLAEPATRLPAHGPPPGGRGASTAARGFDHLYESAATFDEVYAGDRRGARRGGSRGGARARSSTRCRARRWWPSARSSCCAPTSRVEVTDLPGALVPRPGLGRARHRPAGRGGPAGRRRPPSGPSPPRETGPFLVAQCWSRHLLSEVKLAAPTTTGRAAAPAGAPAPPRARRRGRGRGRLVGARPDARARPPHLALRAGAAAGRPAAAARRWPGWPRSWTRCASAARGTAPRPTRRSCRTWSRSATRSSTPSADCPTRRGRRHRDAAAHLEEELGDLLFQIVFHARLADEEGRSTWPTWPEACTTSWCTATRTSSATSTPPTPEQVVANWEEIKKSEKGRTSVTEGIPAGLPALMLTTKLPRKARSVRARARRRGRSPTRRPRSWRR